MSFFFPLLAVAFILCFRMGYRRLVRLQHLNQKRLINGFIAVMIIFTGLAFGQWLDLFSQDISAQFTMVLYTLVAGFFSGFSFKMIRLRQQLKAVEYVYRSFWTDAAPNILAVLLITFGLYRTELFTLGPFTGIGITSGLSLLSFGLFGITIKIVPEFRKNSILILDQFVPWERVMAYRWKSENVIQIDYYTRRDELTDFKTYIPSEDEVIIERLLGKKLKEYEQERKQQMVRTGKTA